MRDGISNIQVVKAAQQTLSGVTPNYSQAFDVQGFGSAAIDLHTGTVTDAGTVDGFTMTLQHSDTLVGADFVAVPAGEFDGTASVLLDASDDIIAGSIGYLGNKRYVRAAFVGTTLTSAVVFAVGNMGKPHRAPVTRVGASIATT